MANQTSPSGKKKTTRKTPVRSSRTKTGATKKTTTRGTTQRAAKPKSGTKPAARAASKDVGLVERSPIVSWQRRQQMIAEAAYYRAEERGFVGGDPTVDWNEAEAEIDALLATRDA